MTDMKIQFSPATTQNAKLKALLAGPAGSGKTKTSLLIMRGLVGTTGRIALVDTEGGRASNYAKMYRFDTVRLNDFSPELFIACIEQAVAAGYDGLILDSASHEWMGEGGVLSIVDQATKNSNSKNQFTSGWSKGTLLHQKFVEAILRCSIHIIVTVRAKMDYVLVDNKPQRVGLGPVQRDSFEYEFDVTAMMNSDHELHITKTSAMFESIDDKVYVKPGIELGEWFAQALSEVEVIPMPSESVIEKPAAKPVAAFPHGNGQGTRQPPLPPSSAPKPVQEGQHKMLMHLYEELHGSENVLVGVDGLFQSQFEHPLSEANAAEASQVINAMIAEKKARK